MNRRVAVRGVIFLDGRLLCLRLKPYNDTPGQGTFWCVPGGGIDDGESLEDALEREFIEELGIKPKVGNLLYIQQYKTEKREYLEFIYHIVNAEQYRMVNIENTSHGQKEIEEMRFEDPTKINLYPKFLTTDDIEARIKSQKPTAIFDYLNS